MLISLFRVGIRLRAAVSWVLIWRFWAVYKLWVFRKMVLRYGCRPIVRFWARELRYGVKVGRFDGCVGLVCVN